MTKLNKFIKSIGNALNKDKFIPIIIVFSIVFFVLTSIFPYWQKNNDFIKFLSPDENANYIGKGSDEDWGKFDWIVEYKAKKNAYVYLSARNNTCSGNVKVEIFKNGKLIYQAENTKPYGVAVVSGFIK